MAKTEWSFGAMWPTIWSGFRDVASWALGAYWGNQEMGKDAPADLVKIALVATLLGLPFVFRADELRLRSKEDGDPEPGSSPTPSQPVGSSSADSSS